MTLGNISRMPAPAPQPAENGAPRTELQELQLKAQQTTDEVFINNFNKFPTRLLIFQLDLLKWFVIYELFSFPSC